MYFLLILHLCMCAIGGDGEGLSAAKSCDMIIIGCAAHVRSNQVWAAHNKKRRPPLAHSQPLPEFNESLALFLGDLRAWVFSSQVKAARHFGLTHTTVSRYESGQLRPPLGYVAELARLLAGREEAGSGVMQGALLDEVNRVVRWCYVGEKPFASWQELERVGRDAASKATSKGPPSTAANKGAAKPEGRTGVQVDWGEAPDVSLFYGRQRELGQLQQWIVQERCRLVGLIGMGGVGKTMLAAALGRGIAEGFDGILWRSLLNAPSADSILSDCLGVLDGPADARILEPFDRKLNHLIDCLQRRRCLIVLDNFETVLSATGQAGSYREGFEEYGVLLRRVGETAHGSCVLLTSREAPYELAIFEGPTLPVRSLALQGVEPDIGRTILQHKGLKGSERAWQSLVQRYAGNPLALKCVGETIVEIFDGDIDAFLRQDITVFGEIRQLLGQHFDRLTRLERDIVYWLAVERQPTSLETLRRALLEPVAMETLVEALRSLRRRSLIERTAEGFTLQNVVLEYATARFVEQGDEEIRRGEVRMLNSHALLKAQANELVRQSQMHLVLQPLAERLLGDLGRAEVERRLRNILESLQGQPVQPPGYAAGNVLNLLLFLGGDLRAFPFAGLAVWQAFLRDARLVDVNLAGCDLVGSVFADAFVGINTIALSPGAELLAMGAKDEVRLWTLASREPVARLLGHAGLIWAVTFSPGGNILASGSADHMVRLWHVPSGASAGILAGHSGWVWGVDFAPKGKYLASVSEDQTVRVWDVESRQAVHVLEGHGAAVLCVAFSPDGQVLASGGADGTVRLWEVESGRCLSVLDSGTRLVRALAWGCEGRTVAVGGADGDIRLWEAATGRRLGTLTGHAGAVAALAYGPDGRTLASGSYDRTIRVWDAEEQTEMLALRGHTQEVRALAFSPTGVGLISGSYDQTIRFWDIIHGQELDMVRGYTQEIRTIAFSPDGRQLASGSTDQSVALWDLGKKGPPRLLRGHVRWVQAVAFSPAGDVVASGSFDRSVRLWDAKTGRLKHLFAAEGHWIWAVAFQPDGGMLAAGSADGSIYLWELDDRQFAGVLSGPRSGVRSLAYSADGTRLVAGDDEGMLHGWETATKAHLWSLAAQVGRIQSVAHHPSAAQVAVAGAGGVAIWDVAGDATGGKLALRLPAAAATCAAYSEDGEVLAVGGEDGKVSLWPAARGERRREWRAHRGALAALAFRPGTRLLATASLGNDIRLWDVESGKEVSVLRLDRPYERLRIGETTGLTDAQRATLYALGAIDE